MPRRACWDTAYGARCRTLRLAKDVEESKRHEMSCTWMPIVTYPEGDGCAVESVRYRCEARTSPERLCLARTPARSSLISGRPGAPFLASASCRRFVVYQSVRGWSGVTRARNGRVTLSRAWAMERHRRLHFATALRGAGCARGKSPLDQARSTSPSRQGRVRPAALASSTVPVSGASITRRSRYCMAASVSPCSLAGLGSNGSSSVLTGPPSRIPFQRCSSVR